MTGGRIFVWTAAAVLAAFAVPFGAPVLGMHVAGRIWNALRLTAPFLSQVGDVLAGAVAAEDRTQAGRKDIRI